MPPTVSLSTAEFGSQSRAVGLKVAALELTPFFIILNFPPSLSPHGSLAGKRARVVQVGISSYVGCYVACNSQLGAAASPVSVARSDGDNPIQMGTSASTSLDEAGTRSVSAHTPRVSDRVTALGPGPARRIKFKAAQLAREFHQPGNRSLQIRQGQPEQDAFRLHGSTR